MAFNTFTILYNHHLYLIPKHLQYPRRKPIPIKKSVPLPFRYLFIFKLCFYKQTFLILMKVQYISLILYFLVFIENSLLKFTNIFCFLLEALFFYIFIGVQLLYNVVLVSAVQQKVNQLFVYMYLHIPSLLSLPPNLPIPRLQVVTKQGVELPELCSSFPIAIHFTFGSVCMSMLLSHFVPASPPIPVSSSLFSTPASLFLPCHQVHQNRYSIYMRQHTVFVFLFLTYFTLYDRFQVHPCCCK